MFYFLLALSVCIGLGIFLYRQNNRLSITRLEYASDKLPQVSDTLRIACMADLHNKCFSTAQQPILEALRREAPDLIAFCGDLIDGHTGPDMQSAITLISGCLQIAPVYYVSGNNEAKNPYSASLFTQLEQLGVHLLRNNSAVFYCGTEPIYLLGVDDMAFQRKGKRLQQIAIFQQHLQALSASVSGFKLLLSHRPELIDLYNCSDVQLVLSGHAHGGQFRLPFIGGFFAPGQGIFPRYTAGLHHFSHFSLAITRGLGNSSFPFRLFNPPEILVLTLRSKKGEN